MTAVLENLWQAAAMMRQEIGKQCQAWTTCRLFEFFRFGEVGNEFVEARCIVTFCLDTGRLQPFVTLKACQSSAPDFPVALDLHPMFACCAAEEPENSTDIVTDVLPKATAVIEDAIVVEKLPPAPEFGQFKVTVPGDDFQSLGLEVDKTSVRLPMITEVKDGAVQKFNEMNPQTKIQVLMGGIGWFCKVV